MQRKEHNVERYIQWVTRRRYGSIFIRLGVVASQICEIPRNITPKIRTHNSSMSTKVIDLGANRKCIMQLPVGHY